MKNPLGTSLALFWLGAFATIHLVKPQTQESFINLDCGLPLSESPYIEPENEIQYSSDENFIQIGKIGIIPKNLALENLKPYSTLRYFPDGIRKCYDIKVAKGGNYLIRAMFLYGNFDGLNVSPEFDMYIGPNKWITIDMQKEPSGLGKEIIHIPRSNSLQICLVKTGSTTPMISTLELRPLANDTYIATSGSLKLNFRMYLSNSTTLLRYYLTSELSEKSDIYSFGILLLEMITNQRVIDQTRDKTSIVEWVKFVIKKGDTNQIVDPKLQGNYEPRSIWKALEVAMSCANPSSAKRPNMSQVIIKLKECLAFEDSRTSRNQDMDSVELSVSVTFDTEVNPRAR
ncbi:unnamed protein product [Cochlearia groenlandica]